MICSSNSRENGHHGCRGSQSSIRGGASRRDVVRSDGDIQSELAVFLPSAQTFINITSQSIEKPTANVEGSLAPSEGGVKAGLGTVVHGYVHLHLVLQDLDQLLHGGQVTRLQLGPHRHIV